MKILVTPNSMQPDKKGEALDRLKAFADELVGNPYGRVMTEDELIAALADCDGMIAGLEYITAKVLRSCPKLKVIARYGAGTDTIDLKVAKDCGIVVTNAPGMNAESVGEMTFGMIVALSRRLLEYDKGVKAGGWPRWETTELFGKTLGIIGYGAIGKVTARCGRGFGMQVLADDPYIAPSSVPLEDAKLVSFEEVLKNSDVVSLHCPRNEETINMINKDTIAMMKDGAVLINCARGGIANEDDVYAALKSGKLAGFGMDVYQHEPPKNSPLASLDNVIMTPHAASHTHDAFRKVADCAVNNCIMVLEGKKSPCQVN